MVSSIVFMVDVGLCLCFAYTFQLWRIDKGFIIVIYKWWKIYAFWITFHHHRQKHSSHFSFNPLKSRDLYMEAYFMLFAFACKGNIIGTIYEIELSNFVHCIGRRGHVNFWNELWVFHTSRIRWFSLF